MRAGNQSATYHQKGHVGTAVAWYLVVVRNCYSKAQKDSLGTDSARTAKEDSLSLSLIHISEPTRLGMISYAVFCLKKKK